MLEKIKIKVHGFSNLAILRELIDEFISPEKYEIWEDDGFLFDDCIHINRSFSADRDEIKREIFNELANKTDIRPDWGILTGVRPIKLAGELLERFEEEKVRGIFPKDYYLTEDKTNLVIDIYKRQIERCGKPGKNSVGVYIGVPFCPTRCIYCSFASNQVDYDEIEKYVPALIHEIRYVGEKIKENNLEVESLYFGGGTPTTLTANQLKEVITAAKNAFDCSKIKEFTVEAGRPDTIDEDKLNMLKNEGVHRISINPQSMKQKTLDLIGRAHSPEDVRAAFELAKSKGFQTINADLIAGLPEENVFDFITTLNEVIKMGANNITIHTLAVKRASGLKNIDTNYHYSVAETVAAMLKSSREILHKEGFTPYYLYRQKHMAGFFENTGYCKGKTDGLYNIRIMDEHQSIIALGAGGISKRYYPETNKLVRVPNVTNYKEYINRIDEMCARKEKNLWR